MQLINYFIMNERRFGQSMNPREHIEQELKDADINSPNEWRKAVGVEDEMEGTETARFKELFTYIDGKNVSVDKKKIEDFKNTEDDIERLELLCRMNTVEAMQALNESAHTKGAKKYLANRLDFYQKMIQGKLVHRYTVEEWSSQKNKYVEVAYEDPIDFSDVTSRTVYLGLLRDMMYASMHGTPELAGVKIATKWANEDREKGNKKIRNVVELFGYHSGIDEVSIGQWEDLGGLYKKCLEKVRRDTERDKLTEEQIEHKAVLLMARELKDAYDWSGIIKNTRFSPYNPRLEEAVTVGRLGDEKIKSQLRGMRFKIRETDLHNIKRFIGKSGPNKYEGERRYLYAVVKTLKEGNKEEREALLKQENKSMQERQTNWFTHEKERLEHKFEKGQTQIKQRELLDEERDLQLANLRARFERDIANLETKHQQKLEYFESRNANQLLSDLKERQEVVEERYEKRKSLAQKALDLHFQINHHGGDHDSKPFAGVVDWINYAPLGTIKRSHKMVRLGMSDEQVVEYAIADIVAGVRGATREDLKAIHKFVQKIQNLKPLQKLKAVVDDIVVEAREATKKDIKAMQKLVQEIQNLKVRQELKAIADIVAWMRGATKEDLNVIQKLVQETHKQNLDMRQKLKAMVKVGNIISLFDYEVPLQEVEELAQKNFCGMKGALHEYSLDEVKVFMNKNLNLRSVVTVRKVTQKHGYDLDNTTIAEIASHDIEGLDDAFNTFGFADISNLLGRNVFLPTATVLRNNAKAHGRKLSIDQIATIAKDVEDVNDFISALRSISLEQVEQLYRVGQRYKNYEIIHSALTANNQDSSFTNSLKWTQKLAKHNEWFQMPYALEIFSLEELEQVCDKGITISAALDFYQTLTELGFENSVKDIVRWKKNVQQYNPIHIIKSAAEKFGTNNLLRFVEKEVPLRNALNVKHEIDNQALRQFDTLETIMAIAKCGSNVEVALKTLEAGFTVEEITKYPFLISPLLVQK
jgi:hypothetical protein